MALAALNIIKNGLKFVGRHIWAEAKKNPDVAIDFIGDHLPTVLDVIKEKLSGAGADTPKLDFSATELMRYSSKVDISYEKLGIVWGVALMLGVAYLVISTAGGDGDDDDE